ncbi:hypothetical protein SKAU_G00316910 [Synaphobranchus kaupii]|uniref:Uncharacterized protein n=1 Tax=Synaphobranchus kaupii TaxID=118154 RepID=A0A9Q1ESW1_SYNKA|nr:hypothetical protein SKAU_G00316910 [Synaphobranchus kaupii]
MDEGSSAQDRSGDLGAFGGGGGWVHLPPSTPPAPPRRCGLQLAITRFPPAGTQMRSGGSAGAESEVLVNENPVSPPVLLLSPLFEPPPRDCRRRTHAWCGVFYSCSLWAWVLAHRSQPRLRSDDVIIAPPPPVSRRRSSARSAVPQSVTVPLNQSALRRATAPERPHRLQPITPENPAVSDLYYNSHTRANLALF